MKPSDVPCHSRDIWAFGQLMLVLLEDTALEGRYKGYQSRNSHFTEVFVYLCGV